jgi:hypothetical protein
VYEVALRLVTSDDVRGVACWLGGLGGGPAADAPPAFFFLPFNNTRNPSPLSSCNPHPSGGAQVKPKTAKKWVDGPFCSQLIELFDSEDPRER